MKTIGNIIWFLLVGIESCLSWFVLGLLWCVTIVGIPFGLQCFKMGRLFIWPFGTAIHGRFSAHPIANVLWFIFGGLGLAVGYAVVGLLLCITVVGIPFGRQCFKLMRLSAFPFGADIG